MNRTILCLIFVAPLVPVLNAQVNPVPLVNQPLVPASAPPLGPAFTLTVNGTGFVSGSTVNWNGSARATTFLSSSSLTASILASDIAAQGAVWVTVVNPGAPVSNPAFFEINNPSATVSFSSAGLTTGDFPNTIGVADLNADGKADMVTVNEGDGTVYVFLGNGDGTFASPNIISVGGQGQIETIAFGDYNGDGKLDFAVAGANDNNVLVLLGNGDGTFGTPMQIDIGLPASDVVSGDFNGDGKLDLAVSNATNLSVSVLLGNGDGKFQAPLTSPAGGRTEFLAVGDFNGDGKLDLATANAYTPPEGVSVLLGNGNGTFQSPILYTVGTTPQNLTTADLNGDGKLDLAVINYGDGTISVLLGKGDGTFQVLAPIDAVPSVLWVGAGDFDGDGKMDLATTGVSSTALLLGNGDGTFRAPLLLSNGANSIAAGDFNGDGTLDLATTSISVLLQNAAPAVSLKPSSLTFPTQLVGTTSTPKTAKLTNSGTAALANINATSQPPFNAGGCPTNLPVNATCSLNVTYTPITAGQQSGSVTITDNAPNSPQVLALTGTGTLVEVAPARLTFGTQTVGTTSSAKNVTVTNTGSTSVRVTNETSPASFLHSRTCSTLAPGASCGISVQFAPTTSGAQTGTLKIHDSDHGSPQVVTLSGTGTDIGVSPTHLSFGSQRVGTLSPPETVTVTNVGTSTVTVAISDTDSAEFPSSPASCTLSAGASCSVAVQFEPVQTGPRGGTLRVTDSEGGTQIVTLSGTGR